jgi:hypothetical protein
MVHKKHTEEKFEGLLEKDYLQRKIQDELKRSTGAKYPIRFWKMKLVDMRILYDVLKKAKTK